LKSFKENVAKHLRSDNLSEMLLLGSHLRVTLLQSLGKPRVFVRIVLNNSLQIYWNVLNYCSKC